MDKLEPASLSADGRAAISKEPSLRLSRKSMSRFINQVAVRLSHDTPISLKDVIGEIEKKVIVQVLNAVGGSQKDAARILGMKYTTLCEKLKRYHIRVKRIPMIE